MSDDDVLLANLQVYAEVTADQLRRQNRELSELRAKVESLSTTTEGAVELLRERCRGPKVRATGATRRTRANSSRSRRPAPSLGGGR